MGQVSTKQRTETELLLFLFINCINKNYELLGDDRVNGKEVKRYTAEYSG